MQGELYRWKPTWQGLTPLPGAANLVAPLAALMWRQRRCYPGQTVLTRDAPRLARIRAGGGLRALPDPI